MDAPLVLIHGANAGPWIFANFAEFFGSRGLACHCPAYRYHDPSPRLEDEALIKGLSIADYVNDIASFVRTLNAPPILVGHSLGGIIAQQLASRGLASAVVLLNGSVNWGVLPTTDHERRLARMFISTGPFWDQTLLPDFETMSRFGLNKLEVDEQYRVYDRLGPESGQAMFELFFWMFDDNQTTRIDYSATNCPVLVVSGTDDLAIPPSTSRRIAERYG
ncbi:MAG: alpha/beta fold hydrolase, partial [Planctomycetota bacterium]